MSDQFSPLSHVVTLRELPTKAPKRVALQPDEPGCAEIAKALDVVEIAKMRVEATIKPVGDGVWSVEGVVGATVTQSCVITLAPVKQRVDEPIQRVFSADATDEIALDPDFDYEDDDPPDPVGDGVDIGAIAVEALSLALDPYPRADGAAFEPVRAAPPGVTPMTPEQAKPFAGLAALKKSMQDGGDGVD